MNIHQLNCGVLAALMIVTGFAVPIPVRAANSGHAHEIPKSFRVEAKQYMKYFHSIKLTKEQKVIKADALTQIAAPCCSKFSMATCCCECNLAKSVWGLSHYLIVNKGYKTAELKTAVEDWIQEINPKGFSGQACFNGGCMRSFDKDGCGGMDERKVM